MASVYVSVKARILKRKLNEVYNIVKIKYHMGDMDLDQMVVHHNAMYQSIQEMYALLGDPSVRGHEEPKLRKPEVNARSSTIALLKRLKRQVEAACLLADDIQNGPLANEMEVEALAVVEQELDRLYDIVSV